MRLLFLTQHFSQKGEVCNYAEAVLPRLAREAEHFVALAPSIECSQRLVSGPSGLQRVLGNENTIGFSSTAYALRLIQKERIDAAFACQWSAGIGAALLRRSGLLKRFFVVAHDRELLLSPFRRVERAQAVYDRVRRAVLAEADCVFTSAPSSSELVRRIQPNVRRVEAVSRGIELGQVAGAKERGRALRLKLGLGQRPVILVGGQLNRHLGVDVLLRALRELVKEHPHCVCVVMGDGPERMNLEYGARSLGVTAHVRFVGPIDEATRFALYALSDVFVAPARDIPGDPIGVGTTLVEAGACGTALIASENANCNGEIEAGESGVVIPCEDAPALTQQLRVLLADQEYRERLGDKARNRAHSEHGWDEAAAQLWRVMGQTGPEFVELTANSPKG